nr:PREDICTED: PHD finger protein rhinoceros isoform X3 [Megachile rotundata]
MSLDLEEALLTDGGTEGRLVQELIVRLLEGCLPNDTRNDISTFNYQMFLRRLFRKKCQEYKCENPFNTDVDFELLPLRQKVEILRALCDFRLDAEDVEQSLSNLDSDSLRVEPLGHDRKNSAYWYFYGTRLYREDYIDTSNSISYKQKNKPRDKKRKRRRNRVAKEEEEEEEKKEDSLIHGEGKESVWQVVCFTQQDWSRLVEKFRDSEYDTERKLYRTLSEDFMPEIPKLFDLKEKQQRRKLLQRNSSRVLRSHEPAAQMETVMVRSKIKTKTNKGNKKGTQNSKNVYVKEETPPPLPSPPVQKKGRQTNNSLASAVGQIVIHTDEVEGTEKKKGVGSNSDGNYVASNYGYKYGYSFGIEEEERRVGMHKVLESLKDHVDAWPFIDPVDEEYAPRYYSVVRKPMDLSTMEEKLENGLYKNLNEFKRDFRLIVDNCRQYNGSDNEYTEMAFNLKEAFDKAVNRYLESETSSDEDTSSPKSCLTTPTSPSCPSRVSSPHQNRKRSKKSTKKSKSYKSESKGKSKVSDKNDEEEKRGKNYKLPKKKRGKKKSKRVKDEESVNEEEQEEQESEDAMSESSIITSKRRKHLDVNNLLLKTKKLSPKESEEFKKMDRKMSKERHQQKKEAESMRPIKDSKENKKRKEDFEEDYEPLVIAKSKSRKIEKKELEETEIFTDNAKKNKVKKNESHENEIVSEEKDKIEHIKVKKSRKKEKAGLKVLKSDEKSEKNHIKDKEKKSKQKNDELKNGEISSEVDSKDVDLESDIESKEMHASKKIPAFIGNKDIESLDGLKDKISERRREEKLKSEKEKQKKTSKSDLHNMYSKKVPSNGSTFNDSDKASAKRPKLKKGMKEEKVPTTEDPVKTQDQEVNETKKIKVAPTKSTKGFGKEESSIQALNQATEQTLHDINKWLDDAPRLSEFSSGSDSPVFHSSVEIGRSGPKVEAPRKRPSSIKIFGPHGPSRPKKIQRTIDRLQPGKSKGNLLLKKPLNLPNAGTNETTVHPSTGDNDQTNKNADEEPKLSLGTVLKNVDSIQLICKSLVSSPNPNFSNDDEEEDHNTVPTIPVSSLKEEKSSSGVTATQAPAATEESKDDQSTAKETQKPKAATPNLSAWFKAFGAPKSKKKDEESEDSTTKKDGDLQEVFYGRQRRMSTGGSSVSESVSSFSQESPPGRSGRSPQGQPIMASVEPQIRGAGFYQDALSTGSSPYNSPYYATPPRYSAQLPPTPSPQNHPLSPAYPSSSYEQAPLYSQIPAQQQHQTFQKSPQESSGEVYHQLSPTFPQRSPQTNFPQNSAQSEPFNQPVQSTATNQNPPATYSQHSPQPVQQVYPQPSPQPPPSNYSQPSPQQSPTPKYSQLSPQQNAANYSQPSPQASNYSQASPQQPHSPYSQNSPQAPPNYSQPSPQQQPSPYAQSPQQSSGYSQLSPQPPSNYSQPSPQPPSNYSQPSPQPPSNYSQPSPQPPSNYSQPSPQPPSNYSQPSPQPPSNYSQPSPQPPSNYSQPSPQPPSNYSQPSPQPPSNYSQPSPQPPPVYPQQSQPSNFSHPSPQTHAVGFTQSSPQPLTAYSQPSPQPRNYSQPSPQQIQTFPQHSPQAPPSYSQPSPQNTPYSQPSPQQPAKYSQPSPQQPANYSHAIHSPQTPQNYSQLSPQQAPPNYSQPSPSPQQSRNYSQPSPSPQQSRNYSQPSPSSQQSHNYSQPSPSPQTRNYSQPSPQQKTVCASQPSQQPSNYSQPSPQQSSNYALQQQSSKNTEEYPQNPSTPSNYSHGFKQNHTYIQSPTPSSINETEHRTDYTKSSSAEKSSSIEQQRNFAVSAEASLNLNANHQIYQSPNQYPPAFANNYSNIDLQRSVSRHGGQEQSQQQQQSAQERVSFTDLSESLNAQKYAQQRSFLGKTSSTGEQLSTQDQSQLLAFQQNLTAHESLYPTSFQPSGYPMPNSRPMYPSPHYFDTGSKTANSGTANSSTGNLPPVKKRAYNESSAEASRGLTQEAASRASQEQFGFDPIMALPQPETVSASQFDATFVGNLADSVATNSAAYARLGLGLVGRSGKEQQQLLTIPRPPATKAEHLAYARSPATGAAELDLNLLQSLQTASAKNTQGILSMSRRGADASSGSTSTPAKTKKSRKSKQQQQEQQNVSSTVSSEPQASIPGFPQYTGTSADSIGLKNTAIVPPAGSAFNFAASTNTTTSSPFYDKDATAAAFAFLDEFRNPNSYYSMALRQQQQQQQPQVPPVSDATQQACNKLTNQPPRNYPPHPFLHSAQRSAAYGPPVSAYVTPHGPNLTMDPTAYQQYIHSLYALQPPPHHHRPSWL